MKTFGGFPALEVPAAGAMLHDDAVALSSGRACWHRILRELNPARVLVPFYICDSALEPLHVTGTPFEFYAIDHEWKATVEPRAGELLLAVNYFGVLTRHLEALQARFPDGVVIDDTQAFFRRGSDRAWSFNSARKFFGVPDGGYLYGPVDRNEQYAASVTGDCEHLISRLAGDDDVALRQFHEHEGRVNAEIREISPVSARLLRSIDYDRVCRTRRSNFAIVHKRLGALNGWAPAPATRDVPLCYPLLMESAVDLAPLWRDGLFIPRFWPELEKRSGDRFARERALARRLLPLPIDQRYDADDMHSLCDRLESHLA